MIKLLLTKKLRASMELPMCEECDRNGYIENSELYDGEYYEHFPDYLDMVILLDEGYLCLAACPYCEGEGVDEEMGWEE